MTISQNAPARYASPAKKLQAAADLFWSALAFKEAYLRQVNPTWSEETLKRELQHWILYARS